jgi:hypothetical protein
MLGDTVDCTQALRRCEPGFSYHVSEVKPESENPEPMMVSKEAADAAKKLERILKVAKTAFFEAIDIRACIECLEASNEAAVLRSLNDAKAVRAADLIRQALFGRLLVEVMTAFDPRKPGDFHLRAGMDLLVEPIPRLALLERGGKLEDIEAAEHRWAECLSFEPLARLRMYRNKKVVHWSDPPDGVKDPIISELFALARMTAEVAEHLAHATRFAAVSLDSQVVPFRDSSRAFWGKWKHGGPCGLGDLKRAGDSFLPARDIGPILDPNPDSEQ